VKIKVGDIVLVGSFRWTVLRVWRLPGVTMLEVTDGERRSRIGAHRVTAILDDVTPEPSLAPIQDRLL
jgi:hypothetical protein